MSNPPPPPPVPPRRTTSKENVVIQPQQIYQIPSSTQSSSNQVLSPQTYYAAPSATSNFQEKPQNDQFYMPPQPTPSQTLQNDQLYMPPQPTPIQSDFPNYEQAILQPKQTPNQYLSAEIQKCKPYHDLLSSEQKFLKLVSALESNLQPLIQSVGSATDQTFIRVYQSHLRAMLQSIKPIRTTHIFFEKALKQGVSMNLGQKLEQAEISTCFSCHEIYNNQFNKLTQFKPDDGLDKSSNSTSSNSSKWNIFKSKKKAVPTKSAITTLDEIFSFDKLTAESLNQLMSKPEIIACCNDWKSSTFHELGAIIMFRPMITRNYIQEYNRYWSTKASEEYDDNCQKIVFSDIFKLDQFRDRLDTVIQKMQDEVKSLKQYKLIEPFIKILKIFGNETVQYNFYCDFQMKMVEIKSPQYMNRAARTKTYPELTMVLFSATSESGGIQLIMILEDTDNYAKFDLPNYTFMFDCNKSMLTTEHLKGELKVVCHNLALIKPQCRECSDGFNPRSISFSVKKRDYDQFKFNVDNFVELQTNSSLPGTNLDFYQKMKMKNARLNRIYI